jgi:hypothetical protein
MALINIAFGAAGGKNVPNGKQPLFRKIVAETIASAATSTQTTNSMPASPVNVTTTNRAVRIYTDTGIWVEIGPNPTAAANTSLYIAAGQTEYLYVDVGDRVAVLVP